MKHFYPDGRGLSTDDSAPIRMAQGLIEWFHEDVNDVNHMLWFSHSQILKPVAGFWSDLLDSTLNHHY